MKQEVENQIKIIQEALDQLVRLSFERDEMYNNPFGKVVDMVVWQMAQNVNTLRINTEYLAGV